MKLRLAIIFASIVLLSFTCRQSSQNTPTEIAGPESVTPQPASAGSPSPQPTHIIPSQPPAVTASPLPTISPLVTATSVPTMIKSPQYTATFEAEVNVTTINLRAGASTVHGIAGQYAQGTKLLALGKESGAKWIYVETPSKQKGWVSIDFIRLKGDPALLPIIENTNSYLIYGKVIDEFSSPIDRVNIAVYKNAGGQELRTDAYSIRSGEFFAYLPLDTSGQWNVEVVGVNCISHIMGPDCRYSGHFEPAVITLEQLPLPVPLVFTYKK